jgi:hypothetical protein
LNNLLVEFLTLIPKQICLPRQEHSQMSSQSAKQTLMRSETHRKCDADARRGCHVFIFLTSLWLKMDDFLASFQSWLTGLSLMCLVIPSEKNGHTAPVRHIRKSERRRLHSQFIKFTVLSRCTNLGIASNLQPLGKWAWWQERSFQDDLPD